jgi:prepilin peptidase CpaA
MAEKLEARIMMLSIIIAIYCILNVAIATYDFSFFRIPNIFLLLLIGLYVFYAIFYVQPDRIVTSLFAFALVLIISFALFALKAIGAGDAKYLSVISLWVGMNDVLSFLIIVSLVGGGLALIYLLSRNYVGRISDWMWSQIQKGETHYSFLRLVWFGSGLGPELGKRENINFRMVPYGVAIATGAIIKMVNKMLLI